MSSFFELSSLFQNEVLRLELYKFKSVLMSLTKTKKKSSMNLLWMKTVSKLQMFQNFQIKNFKKVKYVDEDYAKI